MRLSEALRLGEFAATPLHGQWLRRDGTGNICGGCAIGRTLCAVGYRGDDGGPAIIEFIEHEWPWTKTVLSSPPAGYDLYKSDLCRPPEHVVNVISALYERGNWSIKQLADYVETIEPNDETVTEPVHAPESESVNQH